MTQDEIIRMAREAGLFNQTSPYHIDQIQTVERFAALVAAHEREKEIKRVAEGHGWTQAHWTAYEESIAAAEREACAKVCEEIAVKEWDAYKGRTEPIDKDKLYNPHIEGISDGADECAAAIRARGETPKPLSYAQIRASFDRTDR